MLKVPLRLIWITRSKSANGIGPSLPITRLATPMPAQFTSTRAGPWAFSAAATAASAEAASATLQVTATPLISAATVSASLVLRSHTATLAPDDRSEEHTSELQSRFGISYAVFCLKKKKQ